jgi:CheY-like chemotaxis protein
VTPSLPNRPIVVIEDSDEDFEVTVWALRQAGVSNPMLRCANAAEIDELIDNRLRGSRAFSEPYPLLILLDLNLPGTDWQDTLEQLRGDPASRLVPVIIISTSNQPATVSECYKRGVAGYLQKPLDLTAFAAAIRRLVAYWLDTVILPVPGPAHAPSPSRGYAMERRVIVGGPA